MALLTMTASSYLINYNQEIYRKFEAHLERFDNESNYSTLSLKNHAVVIGYDELAENSLTELEHFFDQIAVVDRNPENVEELEASTHEYIYGDIRHGEIQKDSGLKNAEIIISLVPNLSVNKKLLKLADSSATKILKARNFEEASELYELGAHYVVVKNMLAGDKLGEQLKLYVEDRDLFLKEIDVERKKVEWRSRKWR